MKKISASSAKAGITDPVAASSNVFRIKPGVAWINGRRVGDATTIALSVKEAAFDLALGRISPADKPVPPSWVKPKDDAGAADGRN